jgi:AraC-like DNA-binding protein
MCGSACCIVEIVMSCAETRLYESDLMWLADYRCKAPKGRGAPWVVASEPRIIFVRRGVFTAEVEKEEVLLSAAHALVLRQDVPFRATHPVEGGDDCTVVAFTPAGWEAIRGYLRHLGGRPAAIVRPRGFLRQQRLVDRLRRGAIHGVAAEEEVWQLVDDFASLGQPRRGEAITPAVRAAVARAQELLAAHFQQSLPLEVIADEVGVSRFYLSRAFRAVTGFSIHRYQTTLRLRDALRRLEAGATNLTSLALDLGFADHSHFTHTCRRILGMAPSQVRALGRRQLRQERERVAMRS